MWWERIELLILNNNLGQQKNEQKPTNDFIQVHMFFSS